MFLPGVPQPHTDARRRQDAVSRLGPLDEDDRVLEVRLEIRPLRGRDAGEAEEVEVGDVGLALIAVPDRVRRARHRGGHAEGPARTADERRLARPELTRHGDDVARRELVDRALEGLRPQVRATLVLRHYYGYDYAQIGAMLGMTSGTVGSTLSRAHAAIRRRFEDQDPSLRAPAGDAAGAPGTLEGGRREASVEPPEARP